MKNKFQRTIYTKQDAGAFFMLSLFAPQLMGLFAAVVLLFASVFAKIPFENIMDNSIAKIFLTLLTQGSFLAVFLLYNKIFGFNIKNANKIYFKNGAKNIIVAIVIGLVTLFGFQYIISFFDELISLIGLPKSDLPLPLNTWYWLIINIVVLAFVPAVCEELVFRGVVFNGLLQYTKGKKNRAWIAIVGSALLFALVHGNIEQTLYPIIFGIVLGVLAYKTKSIIPGMVAHFVNNAVVLTMNFLYQTTGFNDQITFANELQYYLFGSLIGLASGVFVWLISKLLTKNKQAVLPEVDAELILNEKSTNEQMIISNDIEALEKANAQPNLLLWAAVGFGVFFWILSLFK